MARVMTIQGAPLTLGSGWDWPRILGVVAGSGMLVGGGIVAFKGWRKSDKTWLYAGLGLAGAGAVAIAVSWWMAKVKEGALENQAGVQGVLPPPVQEQRRRRIAEGDSVLLGDGERGKVATVDDLADGSQQLSVEVNGITGPEERVVSADEVRIVG